MHNGRTLLIAVEMLAGSIWVGSLVCLALVANVARRALDPTARVALFRGIGRLYGRIGTGSLVVAIGAGIAIAGRPSHWSTSVTVAVVLSVLLVVLTAVGMVQARRMTIQRQRVLDVSNDEATTISIRRGAAVAGALRGSIALMTLVIIVAVAHAVNA